MGDADRASAVATGPSRRLLDAGTAALGALALSLFFHSPHFWTFAHPIPGSVYWDRALQFMQQCDSPLGTPLDDAGLVWRLAPVFLAKGLGLHGNAALLIPWIGLLVLLVQCGWILSCRGHDRRLAFLGTALVATTGATLNVTGWLGINDAWYAAALLALAFQPSVALVVAAAAIGPWVDERFILAAPLALAVRPRVLFSDARLRLAIGAVTLGIAVYLVLRLGNVLGLSEASSGRYWNYVLGGIPAWWPWVSIGWFAGLRAAWILVGNAVEAGAGWSGLWRQRLLVVLALGPLAVMAVLASDTSRAPTMLLPLVLLGIDQIAVRQGVLAARRSVTLLLVANLALPAMNVTYKNIDVINMFPVEVVRWMRQT